RIEAEDEGDDLRPRAHTLHIEGQERNQQAEPDQVYKDDKKQNGHAVTWKRPADGAGKAEGAGQGRKARHDKFALAKSRYRRRIIIYWALYRRGACAVAPFRPKVTRQWSLWKDCPH